MNVSTVEQVRSLADEVQTLCVRVQAEVREHGAVTFYGTATTGELRRRSMDLTRALAALRRSS